MEKRLRSLVLEKFPFELRVEIELLSRRRDLINKEKHDELMKLLRKYDIDGIVPLGPGTNRYAFKLDGFVVKVATDNDGKIDNLKEFKMAKRLFPYVTKTYEVSENGTLLVAEYIQPFESYREMCMYQDKIKDILEKLSDVYLIGDVGITSKNYSNWGLRIGTEDPVCLDFAYVYEVKSELFVCNKCRTGSMLVPTPDFTKLQCSNPACGKYFLFEDIRAKIGNDIHRHEIGDLSEEGYALTESGVLTQLTEERSNYLKRKETVVEAKKEKPKEDYVPDSFVMEHSPKYYLQHEEEISMSMERIKGVAESLNRDNPNNVPILRGRVIRTLDNDAPKSAVPTIQARVIHVIKENDTRKAPVFEGGDDLAFSGTVGSDLGDMNIPHEEEHHDEAEEPVIKGKIVEIPVPPQPAEPEEMFSKSFIANAGRAVSQISNYAQETILKSELFDDIRSSVKERLWPETFYKNVQNAIYHSLLSFCHFTYEDVPAEGGGTKRQYNPPENMEDPSYAATLLFIQRWWMNKKLNDLEDLQSVMEGYESIYGDAGGFQREWLEEFKNRLLKKERMKIDTFGISTIVQKVGEMWCVPEKAETAEELYKDEDTAETGEGDGEEDDPLVGTFNVPAAPAAEVLQDPNGEDDEGEDDAESDEEEDDTPDYISVNIVHEDGNDVVKVSCDDPYGYSSIPLYCNLDEIDPDAKLESLSDNRNGVWDWLIHMSPDMVFTTQDPDRWLHLANDGENYGSQVHMFIIDEDNGTYLMGVSIVEGIYEYTDDDQPVLNLSEEMLKKINNLICTNIGLSCISHYQRSCMMWDEALNESDVRTALKLQEENDEEDEENMSFTDAERAAIQVMMGTDNQAEEEPTDLKAAAAKMAQNIISGGDPEEESKETTDQVTEESAPAAAEPVAKEKPEEDPAPAPAPSAEPEHRPGVFKPIRRD